MLRIPSHRALATAILVPVVSSSWAAAPAAALHAGGPLDDGVRSAILEAVEEGRYREARELLGELLVEEHLARGRQLFAAENPQDGLIEIDRALELSPEHAEALLLRAEGSLLLAEQQAAGGGSAVFVEGAFEDALAAFRNVPQSEDPGAGARVLFGASRAAFMLGRADEALEYSRAGMELVSTQPEEATASLAPERTWANASFLAYRTARSAGEGTADVSPLFLETEDALTRLVARTPADPWAWTQLARLYEWDGRPQRSAEILQRGLDHLPTDAGLLRTLVEIARGSGSEASLQELDAFLERHPEIADGYWYRARERFEAALTDLEGGQLRPAAFELAERDFARCRDLEPSYGESCRGYEVMCRDAVGWCAYHQGDLERATEAFLSMEEVFEGGLTWSIEGRLLSGVDGLEFIAQAHNEAEDWASAADVFELLREYQPDEVKWANNAGFFQRDAAVPMELVGRELCAVAGGAPLSDELRQYLAEAHPDFVPSAEAYRELASAYLDGARQRMRRSYAAYLDAARLAPDDVRIVNDTALVAVYYLHEDLDRAEELLRRCTVMGAEQLRAPGLDEDERFELENAWGDAFQNLGVLYLGQRKDHETARAFFERCVDLGDSRPFVRDRLLPLCDETPEAVAAAGEHGLRPWAQSCP